MLEMNFRKPNCGGDVRVLRIHAPEQDQTSSPVEIKFNRGHPLENNELPARLSRLRCGQETRKTVAPAPRQTELINA
jgi:hypothetical protein